MTDPQHPMGGPQVDEVRRRRLLRALADLGILGLIDPENVSVENGRTDLGTIDAVASDHLLRLLEDLGSGPRSNPIPRFDQRRLAAAGAVRGRPAAVANCGAGR